MCSRPGSEIERMGYAAKDFPSIWTVMGVAISSCERALAVNAA